MFPLTVPFGLQLQRVHPSELEADRLKVPVLQVLHSLPVTNDLQAQVPFRKSHCPLFPIVPFELQLQGRHPFECILDKL